MIRLLLLLLSPILTACSPWSLPKTTNAIVTGGTKGIGHAIVAELAQTLDVHVLTCSRSQEDLDKCLEEWKAMGLSEKINGVVADVSTAEGRDTLISEAKKCFCENADDALSLDILVNNVGTNIRKPTLEYSSEELDFILTTNFKSMYELSKLCHPYMKRDSQDEKGMASIVNIGSVAGVTCMKSGTPYAATKAAMNQLSGNLACEWAPDGIRVNCVTPWYIRTPLAEQVLKNEDYKRSILERTPMGRVGEPQEVAGLVAFLCLPIAQYITDRKSVV